MSSLSFSDPPDPLLHFEELTTHVHEMNGQAAFPDDLLYFLPRRFHGVSVLETRHEMGVGLVVVCRLR
jgi:hypothetical protein